MDPRRVDSRDTTEVDLDRLAMRAVIEQTQKLLVLRCQRFDAALTAPFESGRVDRLLNRSFRHLSAYGRLSRQLEEHVTRPSRVITRVSQPNTRPGAKPLARQTPYTGAPIRRRLSFSSFPQNERLQHSMAESDAKIAREALREYETAISNASTMIRNDLERARTMVRDATARLSRSFDALHNAAASQRAALQSVATAFYDGENGGRSFANSTEALMRQFVDEVVRVSRDSVRIIDQLADLSTRVSGIVVSADAIDGLARETRFIAFNARIETHRAGDAGRTFKVVADEVKRLANASSTLSNSIRQNVSECNQQLAQVHKTSAGLASHDLSRAIESHRGLSGAISKLDTVNQELDVMLETVSSSVAEAVRALQFEDMVTQIINATVTRVEGMGEFSVRAVQLLDRTPQAERGAQLSSLVAEMRTLGDRVAVQQSSVDQGSVELF
ncbi:MAG: methyl-accepting chemotaxis protein [Polyangiales bacterium]